MPRKRKSELKWYVLYGFCKDDIDKTGYFQAPASIVEDADEATYFPTQNVDKTKGFGTPKQWLDFVNNDDSVNNGYEFHLVRKIRQQKP